MKKKKHLQFNCQGCSSPLSFSLFELEEGAPLSCLNCEKKYLFNNPVLIRQIQKFEALCHQIYESQEILSLASIGVDVADRHIKIPFKLLLTRLNSSLDLMIGNKPLSILFRMEPTKQ